MGLRIQQEAKERGEEEMQRIGKAGNKAEQERG